MILCLILIFLGYYTDSILLTIAGFSMLFVINVPNIAGGWQYQIGKNTTITALEENITTEHTSYTYQDYSTEIFNASRVVSFILTIIGIIGTTFVISEEYGEKKE